ncbi:hypothetical protein MKD41_01700 [Lutibacter sp. A64]|uniref:hypothetical protein n=1 Tax=Lutibacter sp. A64 TaxID=2918526 RepID=UPI001F066C1C|nr:hypothetical protein [Lutibacter sp. A64]UMB54205.1 hypothetical protein MKD41_01700 [Lutibacter sp. A64]
MNNKIKLLLLLIGGVFCVVIIFQLFRLSENITHYKNKFTRRYPPHVAQEIYQADLIYNSYYFAGNGNGNIYLGNYTAPLQIMKLDSTLTKRTTYNIELKENELPFRSPQIRVQDTHFFVFEGIAPYVFKGNIKDWKASLKINSGYYFSQLEPVDSVTMAVRYLTPKSGESLIGTLNLTDTAKVAYGSNLLEKQFDGIFDTDGSLHFNQELNRIIYMYRYRNEFIVATPSLQLMYRGNTIDTVSTAQISLIQKKNSTLKTFAEPPLVVNKTSAVSDNLLYVNSALPGLYEEENIWKIASIVDVYDLTSASYRSSFPVYDINNHKMKSMLVAGNFLYALIENNIVCYKLLEHLSQNKAASSYTKTN